MKDIHPARSKARESVGRPSTGRPLATDGERIATDGERDTAGPDATLTWRGAEAVVTTATWMGRPCIAKDRAAKAYRHPELDQRLRSERTRDEANLLVNARRAGVAVPVVFDFDRTGSRLRIEHVPGVTLREALAREDEVSAARRLKALGEAVGRLHAAGLCHGDLTTSNVMVASPADSVPVLIDFGLGLFAVDAEPQAVDLHIIEEALDATDDRAQQLFEAFVAGYRITMPKAATVLDRLVALRERGRYR